MDGCWLMLVVNKAQYAMLQGFCLQDAVDIFYFVIFTNVNNLKIFSQAVFNKTRNAFHSIKIFPYN